MRWETLDIDTAAQEGHPANYHEHWGYSGQDAYRAIVLARGDKYTAIGMQDVWPLDAKSDLSDWREAWQVAYTICEKEERRRDTERCNAKAEP